MHKTRRVCAVLAAFAVLSTVGLAQQQPIRWEATLDAAQRLAGQTHRLVLLQFEAPWCGNCRRMEAEVFNQPSVTAELAANYVPVRINADYFPATAKQFGIRFLPTTVILTPQGQIVDSMRGYIEASEFTARLNRVALAAKQRGGAMYAQLPSGSMPNNAATNPAVSPHPAPTATSNGTPSAGVSGPELVANPSSVPPSVKPAPTSTTTGLSDDRYADYFHQSPTTSASPPITTPSATTSPSPVATTPAAPYAGLTQSTVPTASNSTPAATSAPYQQPTAASSPTPSQPSIPAATASLYGSRSAQPALPSPVVPSQSVQPQPTISPSLAASAARTSSAVSPSTSAGPSPQLPAMNPPLALDGFCPVSLTEKQQWVMGDRRWGAVHRGRTYLFKGPEEQKRFFMDPDRFAPVLSGNDIVLASEQGQMVAGRREHGAYFGNRVYLFASEATLNQFTRNPNLYANRAAAAMRSTSYAGQPLK